MFSEKNIWNILNKAKFTANIPIVYNREIF